ncbi:MAG: MATE family efflux transporter [Oscillospiraceae bacterium]|jgi:putative MATE family efflux protein|nr:MATE family efflux transporter [Oscillospiraceae bacterium]
MTNTQTPPRGLKKFFGAQDMTQGAPMRNLVMFSVPLLIGNLAQQLYSTADSIIVGRFVGDNALAAVGASGPILNLILVLFMAVSTGAGIVVAQYFGAKDRVELSKAIGNSMLLILIAGLVTGAVGLVVSRPMLVLLDTPAENDVLSMANTYLMILFAGMVFSAFYNIGSGILRGLGDSVTPLIFLLIACGLNIILDWVLVSAGWGVMGAAVATIFSQMVSAILCVIRLFRMRDVIDLNRKTLRLSRKRTVQLLKLGLPAGITQGIFSLAMVMVQALTNSMGQDAMTTSVAVMRVDGFAMLPNFTFGMATATFVGQNIGAKRMDRVKEGSKKAIILSMGVAGVLVLCLLLFGHHLLRMFTQTERILMLGTRALRILAAGYLAMGVMQVYGGIMRGAGDTMPSMWISLATSVVLRLPLAYLLAYWTRSPEWPSGSPDALFISLLINWVIGAALTYLWYRRGGWMRKSIF